MVKHKSADKPKYLESDFVSTNFFVLLQRRNGRVVDCGGLENR